LTTQLALEAIAHQAATDITSITSPNSPKDATRNNPKNSPKNSLAKSKRLLDVGAGSGILTIAADLLGYHAQGIDIDPETVPVAEANAAANASQATFSHTSLDTLPAAHYDIIVANIYANVHAALAADYARALVPGGVLLLTGIYLADGLTTTLTGIAPWFDVHYITRSDTWSLVAAIKGG
jgi:ribosomal protein L11 methyltransferase